MAAWALTAALLLAAPDLGSDLQRALDRSGVSTRGLGVAVGRAGEAPSFVVGADVPCIPASNQKVIVAAAAVRSLGPKFEFTTQVAESAQGGHLVVIGDGDPNLSGRFFDDDPDQVLRIIARDVAAQGVKRVKGNLILDDSRFDRVYVHPDWPDDQLDRWYAAPVGALVFNDSCWDVTVRPGRAAGDLAELAVKPGLIRARIENSCRTVDGRRQAIRMGRNDGGMYVGGTVRLEGGGYSGHITVRDPVVFFGQAFRAALEAEGVKIDGELRRGRVETGRVLVRFRSSLRRTLKVMLTNSQNLYAECVLKRLGEGSFESGGEAVLRALADMGVDTEALQVRDGSGLARSNRLTARALYQTLQAEREQPIFVEALAAGGEGTLRRRYRDLKERVRAKTGTIRGVSTFSGYVTGRDGGRYVFAILANGSAVGHARKFQDLVVQTLARAP
jgi:D-alanyl-D-alanine carboxypeptidase/D-alanyl-D-alanine-endopeptidase (penicillin-binding protein 4)